MKSEGWSTVSRTISRRVAVRRRRRGRWVWWVRRRLATGFMGTLLVFLLEEEVLAAATAAELPSIEGVGVLVAEALVANRALGDPDLVLAPLTGPTLHLHLHRATPSSRQGRHYRGS